MALGSVRSSGEATLSRTRRKPPSPPGSCFVVLVQAAVGVDVRGSTAVLGGAVVLARELLVKVSEVVELLVVTPAEGLLSGVEELVKEVASPVVDPVALGTVVVPKTSVWLCVAVESVEVSFSGFVLTAPEGTPEVGV